MADLAKIMGLAFENNGVDARLSKPYFDGTALTQVRTCAQAAGITTRLEWIRGKDRSVLLYSVADRDFTRDPRSVIWVRMR